MTTRTTYLVAAIALLVAPTLGFGQELDPYTSQETIDKLTQRNAQSVDAVSALYADIGNEFNALKAQYGRCVVLSGNEQSLCLAQYDQTLASALGKAKARRGSVMKELDDGLKFAVKQKDEYFETEGNTESFVKALLVQNPDDPGAFVAEQALDAKDLRDFTASFFSEVERKLYALQKARMQRIMIAVSEITVPDVPDTEEAQSRVDRGRKERWEKLAKRFGGKTSNAVGGGSDLPPLVPISK